MNTLKITLLLLWLFASVGSQAQRARTQPARATAPRDTSRLAPRLVLLARNYGDSVVLRWSPNRAGHFLAGSQTGYWVQRIELSPRNPKGRAMLLNPSPLKPWPLEEARRRLKTTDKFPAMALQMLYGTGYTKSFTPDAASIIGLGEEQDARFGVALLAADFSPKAADALGLRWVDRQPRQADALYLYRVYSANPKPAASDLRDTASVVIDPPDRVKPPPPLVEAVENGDGVVTLVWNRRNTQGAFSGFYVERSTDGRTFRRLTDAPYIQSKPDAATQKRDTVRFRAGRTGQSLITYTDSVRVNYQRFQYRIIGVDAFGDLSPASEVVTGMARDLTPPAPPRNLRTQVIDNRQVRVLWDKGVLPSSDAAGYVVGRSHDVNGPFEPVTGAALPVSLLEFIDKTPKPYSNFYTVGAVDTAGNVAFAPAVVAIIADVLPPKAPAGLTAETDSNGVVRLAWPLAKDDDIVAYKVYRSYERDNDFYRQLTPVGMANRTYSDTLPAPILNDVVYYKIEAIDRTGNHSTLSQALAVKVPDHLPPVAPVVRAVVVDAKGVTFDILPSSSPDAIEHRLYRREGDGAWTWLRRITGRATIALSLRDTTGRPGTTYRYALTAVDDAKLESPKSFAVPVRFGLGEALPVRKLQATYDPNRRAVTLRWEFANVTEPYHFVVYRALNGEGLTMFRAVDSTKRDFQDIAIPTTGPYQYAIRVYYHNRGSSLLSQVVRASK